GFTNPIDAVLVDNTLYVLEYGGDRMLWAITFAMDLTAENEMPASLMTMDVFPNPSASSVQVEVELATTQEARVEVFNVLGQRMALLREGILVAGQPHRFAVDTAGWPAGVYLVRMMGEHSTQAQTLVMTE
ncbi:MAG TPA: T9SS type A sorting domain-containing protein, partial [Rhodothermales bacterium]|nr:T9SS type A sorting domain-containing protein [Rhodothermales bacterium]